MQIRARFVNNCHYSMKQWHTLLKKNKYRKQLPRNRTRVLEKFQWFILVESKRLKANETVSIKRVINHINKYVPS